MKQKKPLIKIIDGCAYNREVVKYYNEGGKSCIVTRWWLHYDQNGMRNKVCPLIVTNPIFLKQYNTSTSDCILKIKDELARRWNCRRQEIRQITIASVLLTDNHYKKILKNAYDRHEQRKLKALIKSYSDWTSTDYPVWRYKQEATNNA